MRQKAWYALLIALVLTRAEPAWAFDYLNSQARLWITHSNQSPGQLYGPVGLVQPTAPVNWGVSQWGIPADLPGTTTWLNPADHAAGWEVANAHGRVKWTPPGIVELAQSTTSNALACGTEYDLFISPIGEVSGTNTTFARLSEQVPLSGLASLRVGIRGQIVWEQIGVRCRPSTPDYVNYVLAIYFQASWNQGQTQVLAYQINLGTRGSVTPITNFAFCPPPEAGPVTYCVDDPVSQLSGQVLTPGAPVLYDLEIRNRIATIIQSPQGQSLGLHQDLSHWKVSGAYYGPLVQGSVVTTSRWDGFYMRGIPN